MSVEYISNNSIRYKFLYSCAYKSYFLILLPIIGLSIFFDLRISVVFIVTAEGYLIFCRLLLYRHNIKFVGFYKTIRQVAWIHVQVMDHKK